MTLDAVLTIFSCLVPNKTYSVVSTFSWKPLKKSRAIRPDQSTKKVLKTSTSTLRWPPMARTSMKSKKMTWKAETRAKSNIRLTLEVAWTRNQEINHREKTTNMQKEPRQKGMMHSVGRKEAITSQESMKMSTVTGKKPTQNKTDVWYLQF